MTDKDPYKDIAGDGQREHLMQTKASEGYVVVDSKKVPYAGSRDILGFYKSLQTGVISIVAERFPDKTEEVEKLRMQANGFINEATTGKNQLEIHEFLTHHEWTMEDIDKEVVDAYTRLMCAAFMFRFVMGKREQPEKPIKPDALGKSLQAMYIMSILPPDLAGQVRDHLRAYKHVPDVLFVNSPPAVPEKELDA